MYQGELIEKMEIQISPPPTRTEYIFSVLETQIEYLLHGVRIREGNTYSDYYAPRSCIKSVIEDVLSWPVISPDSEIEVRVVLITYHIRRVKTGRKIEWGPGKGQDEYERVGYPKEMSREIIWSSRNPSPLSRWS
jgi:hypothetical protein